MGLDPKLDHLGKRLGKPGRFLARVGARAQLMTALTWRDYGRERERGEDGLHRDLN